MTITQTELDGVLVIEPKVYRDDRGFFMESWNARRYREAGIDVDFVQDNVSFSKRGVLRGLHFQQNPSPQDKLVSVLDGEIFDVAVDIRRGSPTFGQWTAEVLSSENRRQLFVPVGFAHGFLVLSDHALVSYKCTSFYDLAAEGSIRWDDPELAIKWPLDQPILSDKDASAPLLNTLPADALFEWKAAEPAHV